MGGLKLGKKAGDGPKWWNHENDPSAAVTAARRDPTLEITIYYTWYTGDA